MEKSPTRSDAYFPEWKPALLSLDQLEISTAKINNIDLWIALSSLGSLYLLQFRLTRNLFNLINQQSFKVIIVV